MSAVAEFFVEQPIYIPVAIAAVLLVAHAVPWALDAYGLRKYPGPLLAAFSDTWLASKARHGSKYRAVDEAHRKHGTFVRIAPNNLSIADPDALPIVYGFTGSVKSNFYDPFVGISNVRGLFNTRDRAEHTRKRKIVSHVFSPKSVREFEPYIDEVVVRFLAMWDRHCDNAKKTASGWWQRDVLDDFNFLAFDVIGSLAFGEPFGMVDREADIVLVENEKGKVSEMPGVQILNERGEYSATQGCLPPWIRPYLPIVDPWFARGKASVINLAGIARNRVNKRLTEGNPSNRQDLLARLQAAKDDNGQPMGKVELTAEALTQLIAGSDTTSNSSCAITFFIARDKRVMAKLQAELDDKFKANGTEGGVLPYEDTKDLPFLNACIKEALRRHSTSSMGLPRIMAKDTEFKGHVFKAGTILSVPSYTIHHLDSVWSDPFEYRPERWIEGDKAQLDKLEAAYNPFSFGPRSCVGRNVAFMELLVFISTLFYRYDFEVEHPEWKELPSAEGFLRKPLGSVMRIRRRQS